ncbi:hypothetical protein FGG08_006772 [Glutinoglossum americanum]|uniref:DUF221-domain-containing protein n=1 Tax=Glutinoglossum americanum TaxID=1670608 RepID=A0A9P8I0L3_9PEZI|nr:hypothetical protein FGG08_006772 [Glutinoglossum americanum]
MASKFLGITFLFALIIITPVHYHYREDSDPVAANVLTYSDPSWIFEPQFASALKPEKGKTPDEYLWMYVFFVYVFSGIAVFLLISETKRIIRVRQNYLGHQSTVTDRTIRLSGIPENLRSEVKIKEHIETLQIGKVESVTLCRNWEEIDVLMNKRAILLRKLEEAWTVHLGFRRVERSLQSLPVTQPPPPELTPAQETDEESHALLAHDDREQGRVVPYARERPKTRIRHGFLKLKSRKVDAIDLFEERLRRLDEEIKVTREKEFEPTALAFVTLDSVAACQMAVQAVLDPIPTRLVAHLAPDPSDVVWSNTYLPRSTRRFMSWTVTLLIILLTIFWVVPVTALAPFLNLMSIKKIWPQLADSLSRNELSRSLVNTVLPTVILSLLNTSVPYLYDWLSNLQGMISQAEVELSVISKNFFFTFFNLFIVFTITGTAANYYSLLRDSLKDATKIAYLLARSLSGLAQFYVNLIVLQGIGLFPLRLLEFGSVALYPIGLIGAKTPRGKISPLERPKRNTFTYHALDYAELHRPPIFQYGFYLPQAILILILCIVYSVLPSGSLVLFFGLVYFRIGGFVYKYQLLYAMDQNHHSTGRAWPMMCHRVLLGLGVFQVAMAGVLALKGAFTRAGLIVPLIPATVWFSYYYGSTFEPLTSYIALGSIHLKGLGNIDEGESRQDIETASGHTVDETREEGLHYVNPSLVDPLEVQIREAVGE